jgi:hypothetical protein
MPYVLSGEPHDQEKLAVSQCEAHGQEYARSKETAEHHEDEVDD